MNAMVYAVQCIAIHKDKHTWKFLGVHDSTSQAWLAFTKHRKRKNDCQTNDDNQRMCKMEMHSFVVKE